MFRCLPVLQLKSTSSASRRLSSALSREKLRYRSSSSRQRLENGARPRGHSSSHSSTSFAAASAAATAVSGGLLVTMVLGWEREAGGVLCESAAAAVAIKQPLQETRPTMTPISSERKELRRVALAHLTKSANRLEAVADDNDPRREHSRHEKEEEGRGGTGVGSTVALAAAPLRGREVVGSEGDDGGDGRDGEEAPLKLPPNLYDVDRILEKTPLLRSNNAFHDTLNNDDALSCPYVLNRPGQEGGGIEAVVRFGRSIAGHPKIVHGGVTALTFDNLFGMALFMANAGAVFTAFIKVDYKAALPCQTTAIVDITIDRKEGRKLFVTGRLKSLDGTVTYSSAEALFIKPREASPGTENGLIQGVVV
ncbi:unnamed protein product [Pylaiella littoralis]